MKKFVVIGLICIFLAGCGGNMLGKSCNELTKVGNYLNKVIVQAQVIHNQDPNTISVTVIDALEDAQMINNALAGSICTMDEAFNEIDRIFLIIPIRLNSY